MPDLVLLRHGQSTWNAENRFTGWTDVPLTAAGVEEARQAGRQLRQAQEHDGLDLQVLHTSVLVRAIQTATVALEELGRPWLAVRRHWRLNERHYGALQGKNKKETAEAFGAEQVAAWRRSYDVPPPALEPDDDRHPRHDLRYRDLRASVLPATECLADVVARAVPYFEDVVVPDLRAQGGVLVVAHGNSIRALVKYLKAIDDKAIVELEIPTGVPWRLRFDARLELVEDGFLGDPAEVAAQQEAVRRQAG